MSAAAVVHIRAAERALTDAAEALSRAAVHMLAAPRYPPTPRVAACLLEAARRHRATAAALAALVEAGS